MRSNIVLIFATVIMAVLKASNGKVFSRCELQRALEKNKVSRSFIAHWICLAESESGRNSAMFKTKISYGMYGIFQIQSKEWCGQNGVIGGACWTRCDNFLDDKLDDDIACAMKVFDIYGFKHWEGWKTKCKQQELPNLADCYALEMSKSKIFKILPVANPARNEYAEPNEIEPRFDPAEIKRSKLVDPTFDETRTSLELTLARIKSSKFDDPKNKLKYWKE